MNHSIDSKNTQKNPMYLQLNASKKMMLLYGYNALFFLLAGGVGFILMLLKMPDIKLEFYLFIMTLIFLFTGIFGACFLAYVYCYMIGLCKKGFLLKIDENGIEHCALPLITWAAVKNMQVDQGRYMLVVELKEAYYNQYKTPTLWSLFVPWLRLGDKKIYTKNSICLPHRLIDNSEFEKINLLESKIKNDEKQTFA